MSEKKGLTRRDFLKTAAGTVGALAAAPLLDPKGKVLGVPFIKRRQFEGVTLRCAFIGGANYEYMYRLLPKFEEATGAKVEIVYKGDGFEIDKKLKTDFAVGTVDYDVSWNHTSFFTQYIATESLEPLEDYFEEEEVEDFIPLILNSCYRDGHLWLIPRHFDISCNHYRTDLFEQAGITAPPETWDEFKEMAIELTDSGAGIYGTQFAGTEEALTGRFYEVLIAEGGEYFDENWKPGFNSAAGVKAVTLFLDLYQAGAMPPGMTSFRWAEVAQNWVQGAIAMYTEWYGWYNYFQDPEASKVAGKFDIARQPKGDGDIYSGWAGAHAFSVTRASQNKEAAVALVKFLTSTELQYDEAAGQGFLPCRNSAWDMIIADAEEAERELDRKRLKLARLQAAEDFKTPPLVKEWIPSSNIVFPILQSIFLGDVEPQTGLDIAATQVEELMRMGGYYG